MKGLDWERFLSRAAATVCRECEFGFQRPWRGGPTCQQAWLRFHASRGLILTCNGSHAARPSGHPEERMMSEHKARRLLPLPHA